MYKGSGDAMAFGLSLDERVKSWIYVDVLDECKYYYMLFGCNWLHGKDLGVIQTNWEILSKYLP